jgi:hypothetical protein
MSRRKDTIRSGLTAGIGAVLLAGSITTYAMAWHSPAPPRLPARFDSYLWYGIEQASAALQRDLVRLYPAGSQAGPLLARLQEGGFECKPQEARPAAYDCTYRRPLSFDRVALIEAQVVTDGTRLLQITPTRSVALPVATRRDMAMHIGREPNG